MSHDTWIHRLARPLVRPLAHTPVTPNHLTTVRLLSGTGAAVCFALEGLPWEIPGALLFLLSMLMDRADGELARLQDSGSRFGALYDIVTDAVCDTAILIGLGVAAMNGPLGTWAVPLSVMAGVSVSIIFTLLFMRETRHGSGSTAFTAFAGFDPDDAMIVIPVAVLLGFGDVLVVIAAVLSPVTALIIYRDLKEREG